MGRISGRTAAYAITITVLLVGVAVLMSRIARTPETNRYLETIGAVIVGSILLGALGATGVRGIRERLRRGRQDQGPSSTS